MKNIKRIAAVHDLSGYGKASLTVVIPILSTMGIQVCPMPTAVLSSISEFPRTQMVDLTDKIDGMIEHWADLKLKFDAVYSGFLGSPLQVELVKKLIRKTASDSSLIIVDPVMGDHGKLYSVFDREIIGSMQELIKYAQVITPNITEAAFLIGEEHKHEFSREEIFEWLVKLSDMGPDTVIITSVPDYEDIKRTCVFAYDKQSEEYWKMSCEYLPGNFPGTGDTFSSVITGALLKGNSLAVSIDMAVKFVYKAIEFSLDYIKDRREGIYLEPVLPLLLQSNETITIEKLKV